MTAGLTVRSGPWPVARVRTFLAGAVIPIRLASSGRYPVVQSLWFLPADDALWCATQAGSVLARRLGRDDRCGFEVSADAPPYRGVRGTGHATLDPSAGAGVLVRLLDRYRIDRESPLASWLLSRAETEVAVRIDRLTVTSWDYSARMAQSGA